MTDTHNKQNKKNKRGLILYNRRQNELTKKKDYSVLRLLDVAEDKGVSLELVTPRQIELVITSHNSKKSILIDDQVTSPPDFFLPRMGSDTTYHAHAVIRQMEYLGVTVFNKVQSIKTIQDKLRLHQVLAHNGLPTPKTMLAKSPVNSHVVKREIGFPCVLKNITGTQGAGIYLCKSEESFQDIMELIYSTNPSANIIIQEFIDKSAGRDLRVFVVGGRIIGSMVRSSTNSFKANYSRGGKVEAIDLPPEAAWLAVETARIADLDITGVDLLFDDDGFKICEANSAPGFHGLEEVVGQNIAEQILDYINLRVYGISSPMTLQNTTLTDVARQPA